MKNNREKKTAIFHTDNYYNLYNSLFLVSINTTVLLFCLHLVFLLGLSFLYASCAGLPQATTLPLLWCAFVIFVQYTVLVCLPLSSPQNKDLISLYTCQTISSTQSRTLQSSLQQSISLDALAQRDKTTTKQQKNTTRHWHISS